MPTLDEYAKERFHGPFCIVTIVWKTQTRKEVFENLWEVLQYIEDNCTEPRDRSELVKITIEQDEWKL